MDEPEVLKELRSLILTKTGIRNITPADCKTISIEISKALHKNVSETTIKRLFGFAMVRHNFSKFTLTTLSEYVHGERLIIGNDSRPDHAESKGFNWNEVEEKARRITEFTIKSIKNRSGIPYEMTVSRKFSEHDFDDFYKSSHSFTAFISQPGYGKTIILSHLAEKILQSKTITSEHTMLVFINAYSLLNKEANQINFESQLKNMLGLTSNETLFTHAEHHHRETGGKLLIFLDGFSEIILKRDLKNQLFDGIIDFICSIEESDGVKLVMSMRSTTWARFYDRIRYSNFLKKKWFQGNYFNLNDVSNVPPLTEKEVDMIIRKIDHLDHKKVNPRLKTQLKFPFHIQLYYQLKEEDPDFNYSTNITFYELISRFIQDKIYKSNYYTEKILFLKRVVQLTDYGRKQDSVSKDDLIGELSAFKNAYSDLLADGILMEERFMESFHPKEYVRFIHPHIFEYFLFVELLEKFQLRIDDKFFDYIQEEYKSNHSRFQILQWTIRFMIRIGDFEWFHQVFRMDLTPYERNYLLLFIAENLDFRTKYTQDQLTPVQTNLIHAAMLNELMSFDFLDSCYREAITSLIQIATDEEHKLIYSSLLGIYDLLSLDSAKISQTRKAIGKLKPGSWNINPETILEIAENKIAGSPQVKDPALLERLEKNMSPDVIVSELTMKDAVAAILTIHCAMLLNDAMGTAELLNSLSNKFEPVLKENSPFTILFLSLKNLIAQMLQLPERNREQEISLKPASGSSQHTGYSESISKMAQAFQFYQDGEYRQSTATAYECLEVYKRYSIIMDCMIAYELIIRNYKITQDTIKQNELMYERLCFAEDHHVSAKLFNAVQETIKVRR